MEDSSLVARKLFNAQRRLVAAPAYLNTHPKKPASPNDLSAWNWLLFAPVKRQKLVFHKAGKQQIVAQPESRITVNDTYALSQLARAGAGLAIIPEFVADAAVAAGDLQYVLPEWEIQSIPVYAVWPANVPKYGLVKHFTRFIADQTKSKT